MPRVLIVDDHASFRTLAARMLVGAGFDVVGQAGDVAHGRETANELHPDLVLLDVHLPDGTGYELAAELTSGPEPPAVVLTSTHETVDVEPLAVQSGARGFVPKHELSGERIAAMIA